MTLESAVEKGSPSPQSAVEDVADNLGRVTRAIALRYSTEDGMPVEQPEPEADALAYAKALLPTLSEGAKHEWEEAVISAEQGQWKPFFFLFLLDGQRFFNRSLEIPIRRRGSAIISLALSIERAYINDPSLW